MKKQDNLIDMFGRKGGINAQNKANDFLHRIDQELQNQNSRHPVNVQPTCFLMKFGQGPDSVIVL